MTVHHPLFARFFARVAPLEERAGQSELRRELLTGLAGRVLEVGAGTGLNFPHYPASVTDVVAVEPEPYLRARAIEAAAEVPVRVAVVDGVATRLPAVTGSLDAVVVSLVLCSVADLPGSLAECRRVLRTGGELRFYEHVRAGGGVLAMMQDAIDVVWPLLLGGCHPNRRTRDAIEQAGFRIEACRELRFPPTARACPAGPRILGRATC